MDRQKKELGLLQASALVVGNMVGAGVFLLPTAVAVFGSVGLLGWGLTTVGAIFLSLVFARLSKRHPQTGGPYVYARAAFGDFVGFQVGWSYWISIWVSNSAVTIALVGFLAALFPVLDTHPLYSLGASLAFVWGLTFVNCVSLRTVGEIQVFTTLLKLLPLIALCTIGFLEVETVNFTPFLREDTTFLQGLSGAAALTLFSFMGLESATVPAERIKDPERTIPLATVLGTCVTALLYIGSTAAVIGILGVEATAQDPAAFATASGKALGSWALPLVAITAAVSSFGGLNGWILLQGQIAMATANDGLFPSFFAKMSSKGLPVVGLVISGALVSILLFLNYETGLAEQLRFLVTLTTFAVLLPYLYASAAELYFQLKERHCTPVKYPVRSLVVTVLALVYAFTTFAGAGADVVFFGTFLVFSGIPVYVWMKSRPNQCEEK